MDRKKVAPLKPRGISPLKILITVFFLFSFSVGMLILAFNFVFGEKWKELRVQVQTKIHETLERRHQEAVFDATVATNAPKILSLLQFARCNQTNCDTLEFNLWSVRKRINDLRKNTLGREISVNGDLLVEAAGIMHASTFDFPNPDELRRKSDAAF